MKKYYRERKWLGAKFDIEVRNLIITIHTQSDGRTIINLRKIFSHKVNNSKYRYEIQI